MFKRFANLQIHPQLFSASVGRKFAKLRINVFFEKVYFKKILLTSKKNTRYRKPGIRFNMDKNEIDLLKKTKN